MKLLILNGPNLNFLGIREPEIYGTKTYRDLVAFCRSHAKARGVRIKCYQSNCEGDLIDAIQRAYRKKYDGIVFNPAAYTHTSIALFDALKAVGIPAVEVHLSDVAKREDFRQVSYIAPVAKATVKGLGFEGYARAMDLLIGKKGTAL